LRGNQFISTLAAYVFFGENILTAGFGNDIGRNCLLGHRKKIAKFLTRTLTCHSTFLYGKQSWNKKESERFAVKEELQM